MTVPSAGIERDASHSIEVVVAVPDDRATIAAILGDVQRWLASRGIVQWAAPFTDDWIKQKIAAGEFHIAALEGLPVAVVRILWADPLFWGDRERGDAVYVHTMAVRRDYAGRGIGARILDWAGEQAKANGRRFLRLDCGENNQSLGAYYRRLGFTSQGPARVGDATVMLFEKDFDA